MKQVNIDFDKIRDIAFKGIRRTAIFMGLGVNAARDERLKKYQLTDLNMFEFVHKNVDEKTLTLFKTEFHRWIISNGLRELVETYAVFLDRIYELCLLIQINTKELTNKEFDRLMRSFEKLGVERKLKIMKKEFSIETSREKYLNSINRIRNCITHRQGRVGSEDLRGKKVFKLVWLGMEVYAETPEGRKHSLMPPFPKKGILLSEGAEVKLEFIDRTKEYKLGEVITFQPNDLGEISLNYNLAADDITKTAMEHAQNKGIVIHKKN